MKVNLIPSLATAAIITGAGLVSGEPILGATMGVTTAMVQVSTLSQQKHAADKIEETLKQFQHQQGQVNQSVNTTVTQIAQLEATLNDFCTKQTQVTQTLQDGVGNLTKSVAQAHQTLQKCDKQIKTNSEKLAVYNTRLNLFFSKQSKLEHQIKVLSAKPAPQAVTPAPKTEVKLPLLPQQKPPAIVTQPKKVLGVIDSNNFKLCREKMGGDVNYQALKNYVASYGDALEITYVMGESVTARNLVRSLEKNGYEVVSLPVVPTADNSHKTLGDDIKVAQIMREKSNPGDVVILISGDGDYVPTVKELQAKGVKVIVLSHPEVISHALKDACDEFIDLNSIWLKIVQYGAVIKPIKKIA